MKKYSIILCLSVLLTGCNFTGNTDLIKYSDYPTESSTEAETEETTEAETTAAEEVTETAAEQTTTAETTTADSTIAETTTATEEATIPTETEPTQVKISSRENVISDYKSAIQEKLSDITANRSDDMTLVYTLFDMDKDGVPELLIKYGKDDTDFRIAVYTHQNGELTRLADNIMGAHTYFARNYINDGLALVQDNGFGYGYISNYELDENGEFRYIDSTNVLDFSDDDGKTLQDHMDENYVEYLDNSVFFRSGNKIGTELYSLISGEIVVEPYSGVNYRFLESYWF